MAGWCLNHPWIVVAGMGAVYVAVFGDIAARVRRLHGDAARLTTPAEPGVDEWDDGRDGWGWVQATLDDIESLPEVVA